MQANIRYPPGGDDSKDFGMVRFQSRAFLSTGTFTICRLNSANNVVLIVFLPSLTITAQTCRALRDVIACSTSLRYKLALSEHGMRDGSSSNLSTAEKLELLTAHADAWQSLNTAYPERADILVGWGAPIAVSYNIMVFSRRSRKPENHRDKWNDENAGTMAMMKPRLNLLVVRVPSVLRRVEAAHWVLDLPGNVNEVCIDASQDLLIYVTSYVIASFFSVENETYHMGAGVYHFGVLGMASSIRVCYRRRHRTPSLDAGDISACGMMEHICAPMSSIFLISASAVIWLLASHVSTSYPSGTGKLANLFLTRYAI
jgi:hypothetical protein